MKSQNIARQVAALGVKRFEGSDVFSDPKLGALAADYIQAYDGDFGYLLDLKKVLALSARQIAGALNCALQEAKRAAPPVVAVAPREVVEDIQAKRVADRKALRAASLVGAGAFVEERPVAPVVSPLDLAKDAVSAAEAKISFFEGVVELDPADGDAQADLALAQKQLGDARSLALFESLPSASDPVPPAPVDPNAPIVRAVFDGYYSVAGLPGVDHVTLRLSPPRFGDFAEGVQEAAYLNGPQNDVQYRGYAFVKGSRISLWKSAQGGKLPAQVAALELLLGLDDRGASAGEAYAIESNRCARCNRLLTVPSSIHRGLGPECARIRQSEV